MCKNLENVIELLYDEGKFDNLLDECYGTIELIGTIYSTSKVLKQTDPIAYQCYLADERNYQLSELEAELGRSDGKVEYYGATIIDLDRVNEDENKES